MMENKTAESGIINRILQGKFVLIAEIGVNYYDIAAKEHISSMDAAKKMIKAAAEEGIHAQNSRLLTGTGQRSIRRPSMSCFESMMHSDMKNTGSLAVTVRNAALNFFLRHLTRMPQIIWTG